MGGVEPLRWQKRLVKRFCSDGIPGALDLPTGLGKTSVMTIWLAARAGGADVPQRLVYIVDRRAVVDQATAEAGRLAALVKAGKLKGRGIDALPVSTLRGQHADNRAWLADPTAPAIIVGTIDMIGSRLLFEGYAASRNMRPYMAGLLGVDTLVVLDEAHLVPPFEHMLAGLTDPGLGAWPDCAELDEKASPLHLLTLSATGRERVETGDSLTLAPNEEAQDSLAVFGLGEEDWEDEWVKRRLNATKGLSIEDTPAEPKKLAEKLAARAWALRHEASPSQGKNRKILIYCDRRSDAQSVKDALEKLAKAEKELISAELLVGARRVFEREKVAEWLERHGLTSDACALQPSFLIATSAGEVGVDMDADHMVCDLVEWERMVQRLGRVNRRGAGDARIVVVPEDGKDGGTRPSLETRRAPFEHLDRQEDGSIDASPGALYRLKEKAKIDPALAEAIAAATSPEPLRPALTRPLIDAWSMTSLKEHPGRPEVAPWLRGWVDDDPQTTLIWRKHLPVRRDDGGRQWVEEKDVNRFFAAARPHLLERLEVALNKPKDKKKPHRADEIICKLATQALAREERNTKKDGGDPLCKDDIVLIMLNPAQEYQAHFTLEQLANSKTKNDLIRRAADKILVLDARLGGLAESGLLDDKAKEPAGAADHDPPFRSEKAEHDQYRETLGWWVERRKSGESEEPEQVKGWSVREQAIPVAFNDDGEPTEQLHIYVRRGSRDLEGDPALARHEQGLKEHHEWSQREVAKIARELGLSERLTAILEITAGGHDSGKDRSWAGPGQDWWQDAMNAPVKGEISRPLAKTKGPVNVHLLRGYRHEFGSLGDLDREDRFAKLNEDEQDLVRHLVAAHHGHGRPIIRPIDPALPDGSPALAKRARDAALRFVRLQERYGPWRLAWLEALLRAADWAASAANDARDGEGGERGEAD